MTGSSVKFFLWFLLEALVVDALKLEAKDSSSLCKICMCRNSEVDCIAKNIQHVRREDIPRGTRYLYLSENPIVCDCALAELLRHSKLKVKGACANGQHIGKDLALLRYEDFDCGLLLPSEMSRERHRRETEITQCIPGTLNCVPITCGGNNFWLPLATYWGCCKGQVHDLRKSFCESVQGTIVCIAADFRCRNQHCLPTQWVCNGQNDCQDGSDEIGCEGCKNVADSFRCRNKRCIPASRVCDTYNDCGDGSDETFCRWKDGSGWCGVHDFRCANDRCTHLSNVCNDRDDCGDASDEAGCVAKTTTSCEDGWSYYNGRCYKVVIKPSTWAHAQSACRSNDSHLIKITSFGLDYFTQSLSSHISMFWIGLSRSNGAFRWTDGEKLGSFANWAIGSPVMDAGTDCVAMVNLTIVSKTWRNQDCGLKLGYVCDKVAPCPQPCQNGGQCSSTGCICEDDWAGPICAFKPPDIVSPNGLVYITVAYGTMVNQSCVTTGLPRPEIQWLANGKQLRDGNDVKVTLLPYMANVTLKVLKNTELQCQSINRGGVAKASVMYIVEDIGVTSFNVSVHLIGPNFTQSLQSQISEDHVVLAADLENAVNSMYLVKPGFWDVSVYRFRPNGSQVLADMIVRMTGNNSEELIAVLREAVKSGNISDITVEPGYYHENIIVACPPDFNKVSWLAMPASTVRFQRCPQNATGISRRRCGAAGNWSMADFNECLDPRIEALRNKVDRLLNSSSSSTADVNEVLTSLSSVTTPQKGAAPMGREDIRVSGLILQGIVTYIERRDTGAVTNPETIKQFFQASSNLLNYNNKQQLIQLQKSNSSATELALTIEKFASQAAQGLDPSIRVSKQFITSNLAIGVTSVPAGFDSSVTFPDYSDPIFASSPTWGNYGENYVIIPSSAFNQSPKQENGSKIASIIFKTLSSFLDVKSAYAEVGDGFALRSSIISSTLKPTIEFRDPVKMVFGHMQNYSEKTPACVFWDYKLNVNKGAWSRDGCRVSSRGSNDVICACDHLTNFAVLVDVSGGIEGHALPLQIITMVGCTISMLGLLVTLSIHFIFWRHLKCDKTIVHVNLCSVLLLANIVLLTGLDRTENKAACTVIAVLLHYLFTGAVCWMMCEGLLIYISIVIVFTVERTRLYFYLVGWGLPFIIVGISMAASHLNGYGTETACWLSSKSGLIWAFIGPLIVVLVLNIAIFVRVLRVILTTQKMLTADDKQKARVAAKCCAVLLPLLGLTWFFGVLAIDKSVVAFLYLFAICNSLQGFFVFLLHCLFDQQVRQAITAWWQRRERVDSASGSRAYSVSVNTPTSKLKSKKTDFSKLDQNRTLSNSSSSRDGERKPAAPRTKDQLGTNYELRGVMSPSRV